MKSKDRVTGYGYVGRWRDGIIGWSIPPCLAPINTRDRPREASAFFDRFSLTTDRAVLCKITIEVVHDKLGREIRRKPKK